MTIDIQVASFHGEKFSSRGDHQREFFHSCQSPITKASSLRSRNVRKRNWSLVANQKSTFFFAFSQEQTTPVRTHRVSGHGYPAMLPTESKPRIFQNHI